jgi:hypothetical protein
MYDIPDDAVLLKEGLYVQYIQSGENTLIRLFAAEGYAIYYVHSTEEERTYSYRAYLAVNDSIDNYDVCIVTPDMEVVGKPNQEEVI